MILLRLLLFQVLRNVVSWRWLCLPFVFMAVAYHDARDFLRYGIHGAKLHSNIWDTLPSLLNNRILCPWLFFGGFVFVVGDLVLKQRESGLGNLALLRIRSRTFFWLSVMLATCLLALGFMITAGLASLAGGSLAGLPIELHQSELARSWPNHPDSMVVFNVALWFYTACPLAMAGCTVILVSQFSSNAKVPFLFAFAWLLAGVIIDNRSHSFSPNNPLNLGQFISYAGKPMAFSPSALLTFLGVCLFGWLIAVFTGTWRLRTMEL